MSDLFPIPKNTDAGDRQAPLAHRMRPQTLEEFVGQRHILSPGKLLERTIKADRISSLIFYGPPGSGKTTLAMIISRATRSHFVELNATSSNVSEIRKVLDDAKKRNQLKTGKTILFIDELHRFNKAQQDVLMPEVERGHIVLIGATTHNPSFSVNGPLLSRSLIFELVPLSIEDLVEIMKNASRDQARGLGHLKIEFEKGALEHIAVQSAGDARRALTALEIGVLTTVPDETGTIKFTKDTSQEAVQRKIVPYDWDGDYHYDTASSFIKSVRGSDVNAALYWLAKMLYAGEDPRFIARRLVILASEDIGNADPQALILASSVVGAIEFVGMPEAQIILGQAVTYMSLAPKSNASYVALEAALADVKQSAIEEVPVHLRDASYKGAKQLGHGQGYQYAHDSTDHYVVQKYREGNNVYYCPTSFGYEKKHQERLEELKRLSGEKRG